MKFTASKNCKMRLYGSRMPPQYWPALPMWAMAQLQVEQGISRRCICSKSAARFPSLVVNTVRVAAGYRSHGCAHVEVKFCQRDIPNL
jgi:hypothetical protein